MFTDLKMLPRLKVTTKQQYYEIILNLNLEELHTTTGNK